MNRAIRVSMVWVVLSTVVMSSMVGVSVAEVPPPLEMRGFSAGLSPGGDGWAVWSADNGHDTDVYYSRFTEQGWLEARPLYTDPDTWDSFPSLAFAADGTPWVAWSSGEQEKGHLYVSRWVGYRWSRPMQVPLDPASQPQQPALAAAPDGGFWLAWIGFDGNDDEIYASHWDGLNWSPPERVGKDDADPMAYDAHPRLTVDGDGLPWLVWVSSEGLYDDVVVASRWDGRHWSPEQAVSAPDNTPDVWPSLALDSAGQPWVAWQDRVGSGHEARRRILVSQWQAEGAAWSSEEVASSPLNLPIDEERPHLSFDAQGQPHLVWSVWGETSGVAYATWDGAAWTQAAWAAEQVTADAAVLLPTGVPWLLWPDLAAAGRIPLGEQRLVGPLSTLPDFQTQGVAVPLADAIPDRYMTLGDSITLGAYDDPEFSGVPVGPYPERLEEMLDARVRDSEVINRGISGEATNRLKDRAGIEVGTYRPQFTMIMEGTNDVTHGKTPSDVIDNFEWVVSNIRKYLKISGHVLWFSTIIPRMDDLNGKTKNLNNHIRDFAKEEKLHWTDNWQAFYDYGQWQSLMRDSKHPNGQGMQVLADNWYKDMLAAHSGLYEDTVPPTTWMEPLPAQSPCGEVLVKWNGTDNLNSEIEYDVQMQLNGGVWTDWLLATKDTSGTYTSATYGSTVAFHVRGRDGAGNQSNWSAPASTLTADDGPPQVQMGALPAAQKAPFVVSWSGTDACGQVTAFDVQYSVGTTADWKDWMQSASGTSGTFDPAPPEYGKAYYFHTRARDEAGNWSGWSGAVSTLLARYTMSGEIVNTRHESVRGAQVEAPNALGVQFESSNYTAYVDAAGKYDVSVTDDRFGALPPMRAISVTADVSGLDLVLPPLDDAISDGGFEAGAWGQWQTGGTLTSTLGAEPHTGDGAVLLGGTGGLAQLSQTFSMPGDMTNATLSFLVRLEDDADVSSTLQVELQGASISHTQVVPAGGWTHVWLPVDQAVEGQDVTLTFTLSDTPAVRLDEVSLGSAITGDYLVFLPMLHRADAP